MRKKRGAWPDYSTTAATSSQHANRDTHHFLEPGSAIHDHHIRSTKPLKRHSTVNHQRPLLPSNRKLSGLTRAITFTSRSRTTASRMITDEQLYSLALFLGSVSMLLIVVYHFLEVNKQENDSSSSRSSGEKGAQMLHEQRHNEKQ